MMSYCFDNCPDRSITESSKWRSYSNETLPMWLADMDFVCPPEVTQALRERVDHGIFGYGKPTPEAYEAVSDFALAQHGWKIQPEWIVFVPGVVTGFNMAIEGLSKPGDGLLVQTPVYPPILNAAPECPLTRQYAPLMRLPDGRYEIDFDVFEQSIIPTTKFFLLCNPHNPVGRVFRKDELERIADICLRKNIYLLSDEIHSDIIYSQNRHIPVASLDSEIAKRSVTLIAASKTFNIAGLKCSIAIIPDAEIRQAFEKGRRGLVDSVNVMGITATMAAYKNGDQWLRELLQYLEGNRDYLNKFVQEQMPGVRMASAEGTFLAWLDCKEANLHQNASEFFLKKANVALNDGNTFGDNSGNFVRLNFGCPRDMLNEGLVRMKNALENR
jgi:cysteine-S-conjugate beta-lyase